MEKSIAELESAQSTLTSHLESPEVMGDPDKLRETTNAYDAISQKLEKAYSRWEELSDQIDQWKPSSRPGRNPVIVKTP